MPKEKAENTPPNEGTSIASSGNTNITYEGNSSNNINNFTTIINVLTKKKEKKRQSRNITIDDLLTIKEQDELIPNDKVKSTIEDRKKVIPNDSTTIQDQLELILEHVWKYLSINDKKNLTLVNNRINNVISAIDGFRLVIIRKISLFPILTRDYKTVEVRNCGLDYLNSSLLKMFKHLSRSLIILVLDNVTTNLRTLIDILYNLPLLETLDLIYLNLDVKGSLKNLPKFLNLRHLKIWFFPRKKTSEAFEIFACASNIQSLSLGSMDIKRNKFYNFLNQNKKSLNSLTIVRCRIIPDSIQSNDLNIFNSLPQLRTLYLELTTELTLSFLKSRSFYWLTNIELFYNSDEIEKVDSFLQNYFKQTKINELQLLEYEAKNYKEPIITNTKCPNSGNIITTFYHVHHCSPKLKFNDHKLCDRIPVTNLELRNKINPFAWFYSKLVLSGSVFLKIQVRENKEDFQNVTSFGINPATEIKFL